MKRWARLTVLVVLLVAGTATIAGASGGPGSPEGFLLSGTAQNAQDPQNPSNDVIKIDTTPLPGTCTAPSYLNCTYGTVSRVVNAKIDQLRNMLEFKSYFQDRSCGGGSPRIQLSIDLNGDGTPDANIFGYTFPSSGCPPNTWTYHDLTDALPRWDLSQVATAGLGTLPPLTCPPLPGTLCPFQTDSGYVPWSVMAYVIDTTFPLHQVCSAALVDDSSWMPAAAGVAYYDVISLGRGTWHNSANTSGRGFARGCAAADKPDEPVAGDEDHDGEYSHGDDELAKKRHGG